MRMMIHPTKNNHPAQGRARYIVAQSGFLPFASISFHMPLLYWNVMVN